MNWIAPPGLGLVATGKRSLRSGAEYEKYFAGIPVDNAETERADGDVHDTISWMKSIVRRTTSQTSKISKALKGETLEDTCRNIWNFLYHHVQYKRDHQKREQLRQPIRVWTDRKTGVDCDCYSIFISSVLTNLGIPHKFRMAAYKEDYQHVYVIVPKPGKSVAIRSNYYVIDPVVNRFNYEVPPTKTSDENMKITELSGFGECNTKPEIYKLRPFVDTQQIIDFGGVPTKLFLDANNIAYAPVFDTTNDQSMYAIQTQQGFLYIPTVITQQQADEIKKMVVAPCGCTSPTTPTTPSAPGEKKPFPWWWWAIGAGAFILLTGDDQSEVKSGLKGLAGLAGVKKTTSGKRKKKRSYRTITI